MKPKLQFKHEEFEGELHNIQFKNNVFKCGAYFITRDREFILLPEALIVHCEE